MRHSESIAKIAEAMRHIQEHPMIIGKDSKGHNYTYASLDKVVERLFPALAQYDLSVLQPLGEVNGEPAIHTIIMHTSGEWIESAYPLEKAGMRQVNDAQQFGAAITYARRYGLLSAFGVPTGDDDDAGCLTQKEPAPRPTGKKYKDSDPTPADSIITGIRDCTDIEELNAFYKKHKQTINDSPRKDEILSEFSVRKGELEAKR